MRLLAPFTIAILLSGCVAPGILWTEAGACRDAQEGATEGLPPLLLQSHDGLQRLTYSMREESYVVASFHERSGTPYGVVTSDHGTYAAWADALVRLDGRLDVLDERSGRFGGLALRDGKVWVAGEGRLDALDARLQDIGGVTFESGSYKVSHDVIVCPPYALLLDNVVTPIFVYQVDISDPRDMQTLDEDTYDCLCHLQAQWVDLEQGKWYVLESGGSRGASVQTLHTYEIGSGGRDSMRTFGAHYDMETGERTADTEGVRVLAVVRSDPPLALAWQDGRHWLGRLVVDAEGLDLVDRIDLEHEGSAAGWYADLDVRGDVAAVVADKELRVVHLGTSPRLVHAQTLPVDASVKHVAIG